MYGKEILLKAEEIVISAEESYLQALKEKFQQIWQKGRPYGEELTKVTQDYVDERRRLRE